MALEHTARNANSTSPPSRAARKAPRGGNRYVIQKHDATRLHYDLRLELDGVMKSWAVTRGPSLDPNDKRLAVQVEDHPIEYNSFEGTIPQGEYGGGTVMIWDRGRWIPDDDPHKGFAKGHLDFVLDGEKLHGRWHLVRMRAREGDRHENWLLIKGNDEDARSGKGSDILDEEPLSVVSGRSMEEIAGGKGKKRVWHSNRNDKESFGQTGGAAKPARVPRAIAGGSQSARRKTRGKDERRRARSRAKAAAAPSARKKSGPRITRRQKRPPAGLRAAESCHAARRRAARARNGCTKSNSTVTASRRGSIAAKCGCSRARDWTGRRRFAPIADAVAALPATTALIDGELVVEDDKGISNFSLLQTDLKDGRTDRFVYCAFDLLYLDGRDLRGEPLMARKAALARLLRKAGRAGPIRYVEDLEGDGPLILKHACDMHLEGVVSKLRDAPYSSGRSENFVKSKCHNAQEFVVAGFTPSTALPKPSAR